MAVKHKKVSAVADSGDTSLVQPSNWNDDHAVDGDGLVIPTKTLSTIATPPTDSAAFCVFPDLDGSQVPAVKYASGITRRLDWTALEQIPHTLIANGNQNVVQTQSFNAAGTGTATARTMSSASLATKVCRIGYVSTATAGSVCGIRNNSALAIVGLGQPFTGYSASILFCIGDAGDTFGQRMFVGMSGNTVAPTNVDPATLTNVAGIAQLDTDDTQLYWNWGGTAAQTPEAIGTDFPPTANVLYHLEIENPQVGGVVYMRLTNMETGAIANKTVSGGAAILPNGAITTNNWRSNQAAAAGGVALDIHRITIYNHYF